MIYMMKINICNIFYNIRYMTCIRRYLELREEMTLLWGAQMKINTVHVAGIDTRSVTLYVHLGHTVTILLYYLICNNICIVLYYFHTCCIYIYVCRCLSSYSALNEPREDSSQYSLEYM